MANSGFRFPTLGTQADDRATLLAIDDYALPLKRDLCYYLTKPQVRPEPVLVPERGDPEAPDHFATFFYGTVLHEGGRFRMWYYGLHRDDQESPDPMVGRTREGPICYAESADGLHWTKPALGQWLVYNQGRNNGLTFSERAHVVVLGTEGANLIREDDDPDPQRRYKMVYECVTETRKWPTFRTATSPDGLHWTSTRDHEIEHWIEQSSFFKHNGLYYVHGQTSLKGEGGGSQGRQGYVAVSPDFEHWLLETGEGFFLPEPADPAQRGSRSTYDQVHLGVGAASFGNVCVGLYCIWHNRPFPKGETWDWFGQGTTSGDLGLVVSHDGQHFREPVKGAIYLDRHASPAPILPGASRQETILTQSNGILNVGDETRIYHGRWANTELINDSYGEIALATLPRDRWGALGLYPEQAEGAVWSAPVTLPAGGCRVALNADAARDMRIELADARFNLLPAYAGEASGSVAAAGGLDCPVAWSQSLAVLGGQTVRLRIRIQRQGASEPRLYALYLQG
jgi:hypothetical protein